MFHIISLLILYFKEHFEWVITGGYFFVACPPLYKLTVNNTYKYFKNDKEFNSYKANYISKRYKINSKISMIKLVEKMDKYREEINFIKNKYSIPMDLISMILSEGLNEGLKYLKSEKISISKRNENYYAQGLLRTDWLDIEFDSEILNAIKSLENIYGLTYIEIEDLKDGNVYDADIIDCIEMCDKEFKFIRQRLKGLGECNTDDLVHTVLDEKTRDIIHVNLEDENIENANETNKIFFGNNTELRKNFIERIL